MQKATIKLFLEGGYYIPHAIVDGEDWGEIENGRAFHEDDEPECKDGENITVEKREVCSLCGEYDGYQPDCRCQYDLVEQVIIVLEVCSCCGKPY